MDPDLVFKALADASRRQLMDLLFLKDGRSLTELESSLPMTRFGVMKHLRVLRDAGLLMKQKKGRETLHFLNPIPIQMVYDRWVSKYSKGWARSLTELKYDIEDENKESTTMTKPGKSETTRQVFQIYIKASPERVWQALTDGQITQKYQIQGMRAESDWETGSTYRFVTADGRNMLDGKVLESEPGRRLVTTFNPHWDAPGIDSYPESIVTYELDQEGNLCKLTVVHDKLAAEHLVTQGIFRGWSELLSGLKTLLETGQPMSSHS